MDKVSNNYSLYQLISRVGMGELVILIGTSTYIFLSSLLHTSVQSYIQLNNAAIFDNLSEIFI